MLKDEELTYKIRGCVYEVYRHLGAGFLESVYQKALIQELQLAGLAVQCEVPVAIHCKGEPTAEQRVDLLVENAVIIEVKAQKQMPISAEPQLINYLKATGKELGLLVNFSFPRAVVKRVMF
jgi:GxxExxY protein